MTTETGTLNYHFTVNSGLKLVHFFKTQMYMYSMLGWLLLEEVHAQYE